MSNPTPSQTPDPAALLEAAKKEEREACAKLVETMGMTNACPRVQIAKAIRARSEPPPPHDPHRERAKKLCERMICSDEFATILRPALAAEFCESAQIERVRVLEEARQRYCRSGGSFGIFMDYLTEEIAAARAEVGGEKGAES